MLLARRKPDYAKIARLERELELPWAEPLGVGGLEMRPGGVWYVESANYVQVAADPYSVNGVSVAYLTDNSGG